jgi:hypothetical protein
LSQRREFLGGFRVFSDAFVLDVDGRSDLALSLALQDLGRLTSVPDGAAAVASHSQGSKKSTSYSR